MMEMKRMQIPQEKWLGDIIHSGGEQASIDATTRDKKHKIMRSII